jgi:ribosomal protein L11 methyltransferase
MAWLALTVELEAAAADALSDALLATGAQSVSIDTERAAPHCMTALLATDADPAALLGAASRQAGLGAVPPFRTTRIEDEDWVRRSQAQFQSLAIGSRLWIVPSWCEPPPGAAKVVRLDPGLAFGTGSHPSTRLALEFIEKNVRGGERVLDYGCGSGILAIAAAKLGASPVDAVDLDPAAVEVTAANARSNAVAVRALQAGALGPAVYDLVVSNILLQPLIVLAPLLAARVAAGGRIALAGILEPQALELEAAYRPWCALEVVARREGWALLAGERR